MTIAYSDNICSADLLREPPVNHHPLGNIGPTQSAPMMKRSRRADNPPKTVKAAFAKRLRAIMEERGVSGAETIRRMQEHLPDGGSIARSCLSHYRAGRTVPRLRHLDALSLALGVEKSQLLPELHPANGEKEFLTLHQIGDEVQLQVRQRVSWETAAQILAILKGNGSG